MTLRSLTCGSLSILLWNANGLTQHKNELDIYLHTHRIDIALISETHFTNRTRFYISDYTTYRTDHPDGTAHGGTAILVRSTLTHFQRPGTTQPNLQTTSVMIRTLYKDITVTAVYFPPRFTITKDMFSMFFDSLGTCFITGGDYNSKHTHWGSRLCTPRGRQLFRCLTEKNLQTISPFSPTYWPASPRKIPDLLDFFIQKGLTNIPYELRTEHDLSSDHLPIRLTLWAEYQITSKPNLVCGDMDWDKFRQLLDRSLSVPVSLQTCDQLEDAVEYFTNSIQTAAWMSCTPWQRNNLPRYPQFIRNLIREKRRMRKRWHNSRLNADKHLYNVLNNQLKKQLRLFREDRTNEELSRLNTKDGSLWHKTKQLLRQPTPNVPLRRDDGRWTLTDEEKSELYADHLQSIFQPHQDIFDAIHDNEVTATLDCPLQLTLPPNSFKPSEIKNVIEKMPKKKTPGHDLITSEVLCQLSRKAIVFLTSLYNAILRTLSVPIQWKFSTIVMLLKPNKSPHSPSSYRPISLLPVCSKIFEKLLYKRLIISLPDQCIPCHQFGFRDSHSTTHQLHRVVDFIASSLERKLYAAGIFLDVSQAFDRVWHQGLLFKLKSLLPHSYYLIIKSFLSDRFFTIKQGSSFSSIRPILAGVPQGAVLSPLLYSIYTADFPVVPNHLIATFADDTAILTNDVDSNIVSLNLQNYLNVIERWCKIWKVKLNNTKSQYVTFTLRRQTCPPVYYNNEPIPQTNTVKYLGLTLDRRLTWNPHTRLKRISLDKRLKTLYYLLHRKSSLPMNQKLKIYSYLIRPIWTYGSQIYGSAKVSNINRIQTFQSKFLRLITNSPSYVRNSVLHRDLNTNTVYATIKHLYNRFHYKLHGHKNLEIRNLSSPHLPHNPPRRLKRRWSRDLL
jgi:hypothetical protein